MARRGCVSVGGVPGEWKGEAGVDMIQIHHKHI